MQDESIGESLSPDLTSAMDEVFSPAAEPETTASPSTEDTPEAETPAEPAEEAGEGEEPEPPEAAVPEGDEDDEIEVNPNAKNVRIDAKRWGNIYQNHKMARAIQEFAPTIEAARSHYERANDLRQMDADLRSGSEDGAERFLHYWKDQAPEGFGALASRAFQLAPPEVQASIQQQILTDQVNEAYQHALGTGDAKDLYRAQSLDYAVSGTWKDQKSLAAQPKLDPIAEREKMLNEREERLKLRDQQDANRSWEQYTQTTRSAISQQLDGAISDALKPMADAYKDNPRLLQALHQDVRREVVSKIQGDAEWLRGFNLDFAGAKKAMTPETQKALSDLYMAKARGLVRSAARPLMAQSTKTAVAQNEQIHQQREKSQTRRDVTAGGRPAPNRAPVAQKTGDVEADMRNFFAQIDREAAGTSKRR